MKSKVRSSSIGVEMPARPSAGPITRSDGNMIRPSAKIGSLPQAPSIRGLKLLASLGVISASCLSADPGVAQVFPPGRPVLEIGRVDGPVEETLGLISDVEVDPAGRIFVLERFSPSPGVYWFDPSGGYGGSLGRQGQGPGEFSSPTAMAVDSRGQIHIVDNGNLRIMSFAPSEGSFSLVSETRLDRPAVDICALGTRRFLLGRHEGHLVQEIAADGSAINSFGAQIQPEPELARRLGPVHSRTIVFRLNQGRLACDQKTGTIVHLPESSPLVRAYSSAGRLLWTTMLSDHATVEWSLTRRGECCAHRPHPRTKSIHTGEGAVFSEGGDIWVSLSEFRPGTALPLSYELRVLRLEDGNEVAKEEVPNAVAVKSHGRLFGFVQEPFPRIVVY